MMSLVLIYKSEFMNLNEDVAGVGAQTLGGAARDCHLFPLG